MRTPVRFTGRERQFCYEGEWYSTRQLYEHPDRVADLSLEQFRNRMTQVANGALTVEWAMQHRIVRSDGVMRYVSVFYAGSVLGADDAYEIGEFILRIGSFEQTDGLVRRAVILVSHHGAIEGVYLVRVSSKGKRSFWTVGVWDGEVGKANAWTDDEEEGDRGDR